MKRLLKVDGSDEDFSMKRKQSRHDRIQSGRVQSGRVQDRSGRVQDRSGRVQDRSGRERIAAGITSDDSKINRDAKLYGKALEDNLWFVKCGVCIWEGPSSKCKFRTDDVNGIVLGSDVKRLYEDIKYFYTDETSIDKPHQDYIKQWLKFFAEDGTINQSQWICNVCLKYMRRKKVQKAESRDDTVEEEEEEMDGIEIEDSVEEVDKETRAKTTVLFNNKWYVSAPLFVMTLLFRGEIPEVIYSRKYILHYMTL
jgi:hypothetical protein